MDWCRLFLLPLCLVIGGVSVAQGIFHVSSGWRACAAKGLLAYGMAMAFLLTGTSMLRVAMGSAAQLAWPEITLLTLAIALSFLSPEPAADAPMRTRLPLKLLRIGGGIAGAFFAGEVLLHTAGSRAGGAFSFARFALLWLIGMAIAAIVTGRLWRIVYRPRCVRHRIAVAGMCLLCLSGSALLLVRGTVNSALTPYPLQKAVVHYDPYIQQFDAFQKGQVYLDITPDARLKALENPYDYAQRRAAGISYPWDRAYYNGHYYSYFALTPVLLFEYPCYWLTGALPSVAFISGCLGLLALAFLLGLTLTLVRLFCRRVNLLLLLFSLPAVTAASAILWFQNLADTYTLALLSAIAFLLLCLWLGFEGYAQAPGIRRLLLLGGSGVALVLTAASRPTAALMALTLAPAFVYLLQDKACTGKHRLACAAAFLLPVLAGAGGLMWYNAARFGSPLQFGAIYQLTVSDIRANTLSLSLFPAALYHFFAQPPKLSSAFPFVQARRELLGTYGRFVYADSTLGLLHFPALTAASMALPSVAYRTRKRPVQWMTLLLIPLLAMLVAFLNFCIGGVNIRYIGDYSAVLAALIPVLLLKVYRAAAGRRALRGWIWGGLALLFTVTTVFGLLMLLSFSIGILHRTWPTLVPTLQQLFF